MNPLTKNTKPISISTIGDSLTEGSIRESIIGDEEWQFPNCIQYWLYKWFQAKNISVEVRNYGIGGQLMSQICARFSETIPADIIMVMGGTNDVWRYAELGDDMDEEIFDDMKDNLQNFVLPQIQEQQKMGVPPPIIFICTIPPFGRSSALPKNHLQIIPSINKKLEAFVNQLNNPQVKFADLHKDMIDSEGYFEDPLCVPDGVHFTPAGNRRCGSLMAERINDYYKSGI